MTDALNFDPETGEITEAPKPNIAEYSVTEISHALKKTLEDTFGHVRVRGEGGELVAPGEPGVLEVRGPNVFAGYWRMPEKTAEELRSDGCFITGDVATQAADGRVTLVGRAKDLIIAGGLNIYPKEIEEAIDALDGVDESAVIGVPHPDMGEGVVAVVVGEKGASLSEEAILGAIAGQLARFKQPRRVLVVDALPRNAMGKVQKAALRAEYAQLFA